ncbi:MAG: DUF362 domain-containing protein [Pseudomonadota bacterium]
MSQKITRREFVEQGTCVAIGAGVVLGASPSLAAAVDMRSTVVQVHDSRAVDAKRKVDPKVVRAMLRQGLQKLTGSPDPFKKLFSPDDKVGLKINCLGKKMLYTHHALVDAFAAELQAVGVKADNIVIWDRFEDHLKRCNYDLKPKGPGVRCLATEERGRDGGLFDATARYVPSFDAKAEASRLSSIFTTECNKHVNLAILKDHGLAGVTLTLKNIAYGVCDNNRRFHGREDIGPFIADFCARDDVRQRFVLHVVDGIEGCFDGGPVPGSEDQLFAPRMLWLGFDPVALDAVGARLIDQTRLKNKLTTVAAAGRPADHIALAAKRGLGVDDLSRIDVVEVKLG